MKECRGKFDTGSVRDWLSKTLIAGSFLENQIKIVDPAPGYSGFGGDIFYSIGEVEVEYFLEKEPILRKTTFLVSDKGPFSLVLGSETIKRDGLLVEKEAMLGVRVVDLSTEEMKRIAEDTNRTQRERELAQNARHAREAAERQRRYDEQAALRAQQPVAEIDPEKPSETNESSQESLSVSI